LILARFRACHKRAQRLSLNCAALAAVLHGVGLVLLTAPCELFLERYRIAAL
jgi:hypothetical protein